VDAVSPGHETGAQQEGWAQSANLDGPPAVNRRIRIGFSETFARGASARPGVEAKPYLAWNRFMGNGSG